MPGVRLLFKSYSLYKESLKEHFSDTSKYLVLAYKGEQGNTYKFIKGDIDGSDVYDAILRKIKELLKDIASRWYWENCVVQEELYEEAEEEAVIINLDNDKIQGGKGPGGSEKAGGGRRIKRYKTMKRRKYVKRRSAIKRRKSTKRKSTKKRRNKTRRRHY